jgi:hypothetical protein
MRLECRGTTVRISFAGEPIMRRTALVILVCGMLVTAAANAQAGCRPKPHGPYGGACYACGGPGLSRGYPVGYYSFGSWGYGPGYAIGNYGYGSGFGRTPVYSTTAQHTNGYYGPGYQSGFGTGRWCNYKIVAYYFGSGGYICRNEMPRDYGGEYGGIWSPPVRVLDAPARQSDSSQPYDPSRQDFPSSRQDDRPRQALP